MRSDLITDRWINSLGKEDVVPAFCSLSVSLPLQNDKVTLADLKKIQNITLRNSTSSSIGFFGDEDGKFILSIRSISHMPDDIVPSMVELSPQQYLKQGRRDGDTVEFSISGSTLLEIARRNYEESFGFRKVEQIRSMSGIVRLLSHSSSYTGRYAGHVWTSSNKIETNEILKSVEVEDNSACKIFQAQEWYGYDGSEICWYRYLVFETE